MTRVLHDRQEQNRESMGDSASQVSPEADHSKMRGRQWNIRKLLLTLLTAAGAAALPTIFRAANAPNPKTNTPKSNTDYSGIDDVFQELVSYKSSIRNRGEMSAETMEIWDLQSILETSMTRTRESAKKQGTPDFASLSQLVGIITRSSVSSNALRRMNILIPEDELMLAAAAHTMHLSAKTTVLSAEQTEPTVSIVPLELSVRQALDTVEKEKPGDAIQKFMKLMNACDPEKRVWIGDALIKFLGLDSKGLSDDEREEIGRRAGEIFKRVALDPTSDTHPDLTTFLIVNAFDKFGVPKELGSINEALHMAREFLERGEQVQTKRMLFVAHSLLRSNYGTTMDTVLHLDQLPAPDTNDSAVILQDYVSRSLELQRYETAEGHTTAAESE